MRLLVKQHSVNDFYLGPDFEIHGINLNKKSQCLKMQCLKLHEDCNKVNSITSSSSTSSSSLSTLPVDGIEP